MPLPKWYKCCQPAHKDCRLRQKGQCGDDARYAYCANARIQELEQRGEQYEAAIAAWSESEGCIPLNVEEMLPALDEE